MLAATSGEDRNLLIVLAYTICRIDEILRLSWQDVNFERQTVTLWTRKNKSGEWEPRIISMNEDSKAVLTGMWNRRKQEKRIFYNEKEQSMYNRRPKFMRSVCKRPGIPYYGFHCLRHFSSTSAHDVLKVPTGVLSGILGHKEKRTTEIYLHSIDEAARAAIQQVNGHFMLAGHACGFDQKEHKKPQAME
jgi:integrase